MFWFDPGQEWQWKKQLFAALPQRERPICLSVYLVTLFSINTFQQWLDTLQRYLVKNKNLARSGYILFLYQIYICWDPKLHQSMKALPNTRILKAFKKSPFLKASTDYKILMLDTLIIAIFFRWWQWLFRLTYYIYNGLSPFFCFGPHTVLS